jgi:predicted DNA-binding protein (UPF0251 family)
VLDTNKLRGKIAENGMTQGQVARKIGVTEATFCRKMKTGRFGLEEAQKLVDVLKIEDPATIFFASK